MGGRNFNISILLEHKKEQERGKGSSEDDEGDGVS